MFKSKIEYFNIVIKSNDKDIQLSLLKGRPIKEAIDEFNSHIQDKQKHIQKLYIKYNDDKIYINPHYKIDKNIVVFKE